MKKFLSLMLVCLLVLSVAAAAQAEPFYLEEVGVTVDVPEGMTAQDMSTDDSTLIAITVDADANLKYAYAVQYIEAYEGKYIEDLTDEEGQQLMQGIGASITDPQYTTATVDDYQLLVVASGDGTQLHYITLLNGWLFDTAVGRADAVLTDEDIQGAATLLLSSQFDEDETAADEDTTTDATDEDADDAAADTAE
ncbi:MAG: hypothetical protein PHY64_11540 [Eubacteriales bacterium]|nr:hypothetical protein [Eubacteriales bacterium]